MPSSAIFLDSDSGLLAPSPLNAEMDRPHTHPKPRCPHIYWVCFAVCCDVFLCMRGVFREKHGILRLPPSIEPTPDYVVPYAPKLGCRGQRHCDTTHFDDSVVSFVEILFFSNRPLAVFLGVAQLVINALKRSALRPLPHIPKKLGEIGHPGGGDGDASASVVLVPGSALCIATRKHALPGPVGFGP